jgi:hypothetical protein
MRVNDVEVGVELSADVDVDVDVDVCGCLVRTLGVRCISIQSNKMCKSKTQMN